jgi:hypothetical protein
VGAKLKLKALISPRNGFVIDTISLLWRETGIPGSPPPGRGRGRHDPVLAQFRAG